MRSRMVRDRTARSMGVFNRMGQKELYWRGIGQGVVFLAIGLLILGLNIQNAGKATFIADMVALPPWVWVLGGGIASFGLCWIIKNAWLLATLLKPTRNIS